MANGFNSGPDRDAMLRRVAIVLSSLPAPLSAQLMGSIDPESKREISRTITSLSDVDPLERRRALHAFKMSVERQPRFHNVTAASPGNAHSGLGATAGDYDRSTVTDRFDPSERRSAAEGSAQSVARVVSASAVHSASEPSSPLSFLNDVDDVTLARLLAVEHPQAVALVLASIAPAKAARVLPGLDSQVQNDALSRIGRLGDIPEAASAEIAEHFQSRLGGRDDSDRQATGRRALDAILKALPGERPVAAPVMSPTPASTPANNFSTPSRASTTQLSRASTTPSVPVTDPVSPVTFPSADVPAIDLTHKLRVAQETWPDGSAASELPSSARAEQGAAPDQVTDHAGSNRLDSTDAIHQHLLNLSPLALCQALGRVETRDMVLTLCGLPNETTEAALATLPRAQARKVRSNMATLGSLHLREIDEAKERVAGVSLSDPSPAVPLAA